MKKTIRMVICLALVLCMVAPIAVSAHSYNHSGTYNGTNYGVQDQCGKHSMRVQTGSTSTATLKARGDYYFWNDNTVEYGGCFVSTPSTGSSGISHSDNRTVSYLIGTHYIGNSVAHTTPRIYAS